MFLTQFYPYGNSDESNLFSDVANGLCNEGYQVTVFCGARPYRGSATSLQDTTIRTVRVPTPWNRVGGGRKLLEYLYFLTCALAFVLFRCRRTDVLFLVTCPPLLSVVGAMWKRLYSGRLVIWEMDVYPDTAIAVGKLHAKSVGARVLTVVAAWAYRSADRVIAIGHCMKARLVEHGVPAQRICVAENWGNERYLSPTRPISRDSLTVLYSGNLGWVHDVDTIAGAMYRLRNELRILFRFVGSGACRPRLEQMCAAQDIRNVEFLANVPVAKLADTLSSGDVGLVTQRPESLGCVVPSKLYSVLGAGRPVLFVGPAESTSAELIRRYQFGWHIESGDIDGLVNQLRWLRAHPLEVIHRGETARRVFLQEYTTATGVKRVCRVFASLLSR